ncbi:MAG: hypothetical protein ACN4GW_00495 [Desulforhopalus sp.]
MKMLQARLRGLGSTIETEWFELNPRLNLFKFTDRNSGARFINGLQTINPPFSCTGVRPFSSFPNISRHRGYLRRINPKKRTIAMAVFGATPKLVGELAKNSDLLYETDRIEVGRRLDYSRWISFVELSSSSRYGEITADIDHLLQQSKRVAPHLAAELCSIVENTLPSDRIKQELKDNLLRWLQGARQELGPELQQVIETTSEVVKRADYFKAARDTVFQRLPLFLNLGSSSMPHSCDKLLQWMSNQALRYNDNATYNERIFLDDVNHQLSLLHFFKTPSRIDCIGGTFSVREETSRNNNKKSSPNDMLQHLQKLVCLAIALCRSVYHTEPILLFNGPEKILPEASHPALVQFICEISKICQSLYVSPRLDIFPNDIGAKVYTDSELIGKKIVHPAYQ